MRLYYVTRVFVIQTKCRLTNGFLKVKIIYMNMYIYVVILTYHDNSCLCVTAGRLCSEVWPWSLHCGLKSTHSVALLQETLPLSVPDQLLLQSRLICSLPFVYVWLQNQETPSIFSGLLIQKESISIWEKNSGQVEVNQEAQVIIYAISAQYSKQERQISEVA